MSDIFLRKRLVQGYERGCRMIQKNRIEMTSIIERAARSLQLYPRKLATFHMKVSL